MSATDLSVADPRQLLEARLDGMHKKQVAVAVLFFGSAALFIGLTIALGTAITATMLMCLALGLVFLFYGCLTLWQLSTLEDRSRRMVQLLDVDPGRVKRVYGTKLVGSGRYSSMKPIKEPETENIGESRTLCVVVELAEPNRVKRLLGVQRYTASVSREELLELLSFLRGIAPQAEGPPGTKKS